MTTRYGVGRGQRHTWSLGEWLFSQESVSGKPTFHVLAACSRRNATLTALPTHEAGSERPMQVERAGGLAAGLAGWLAGGLAGWRVGTS